MNNFRTKPVRTDYLLGDEDGDNGDNLKGLKLLAAQNRQRAAKLGRMATTAAACGDAKYAGALAGAAWGYARTAWNLEARIDLKEWVNP